VSKETLRLEIEKLNLMKEINREKHESRMDELKLKKEIEEIRKDHTITKRFERRKE